ncbi:MAG: polysaccharide biosynthesis protein [Geodermatophilaceae bacterium]
MRALFGRRTRLRQGSQAGVDGLAWALALLVADWGRYDFLAARMDLGDIAAFAALAIVGQVALGWALSLYRGRYAFGSFDEVLGVATTASAVTCLLILTRLALSDGSSLPRSVPVLAAPIALLTMITGRYVLRLRRERGLRPGMQAERVLVLGAGNAGSQLVRQMLLAPAGKYLPVGVLDDNPRKRNLRIGGVPVLGARDDMARAASQVQAVTLILALPQADAALVREIDTLASACQLRMRVVPALNELIDGRVHVDDVRDVDESDLMGRRPVDTDIESIAGYLTGRRVLVTGAGGSIGSELCRQIHHYAPAELLMLDRDESALHALQLSIYGHGLLNTDDVVLADIRDAPTIAAIFAQRRPDVVFHAAALKHLPLLEQYPAEAYKTNVLGTLNVLEASARAGVAKFVNISTDKAANPCSILGYSKRIAERLTTWEAAHADGNYLSVRFGNVLGSRGSFLRSFHAQIAAGGPVTVTDPDVTRYFMTIPEACQLVVQAAAIGEAGETLVLDMGEPVQIADVARRLVAASGKDVEIVYTGLRPGEKMHEDLFGDGETARPCDHALISQVSVPSLCPEDIIASPDHDAARALIGLCGLPRELAPSDA